MAGWLTESSEVVYETPWFKIHRDKVKNHRGTPLTYSYVELAHPSVFIVAVNAAGEILMQKVYRYTIDQDVWEIPAGHSDGDELLTAAKRELMEETGLESNDWTDLGRQYQVIGIGKVPLQVFLARDVKPGNGARDEDEDIGTQSFLPIDKIDTMIQEGVIYDVPVISALYLAKLHGLT